MTKLAFLVPALAIAGAPLAHAQEAPAPAAAEAPAAPAAEAPAAPAAEAPTPTAEAVSPEAAAVPADAAPLSEADLAGLTSDEGSTGEQKSKPIDIYGFIDFSYLHPFWRKDAPFAVVFPYANNMAIGNLNVYVAKELTDTCRSLFEIRFMYEPNGVPSNGKFVDTSVPDHNDYNRILRQGGLLIERAYAECDVLPGLSVRVGQWLTPYGIWNVDHGTPTLIAINKPFIIGNELFPQRQTGLQLFGTRNLGDFRLGYAASVSNGRGPIDTYRDLDKNKAFGARLEMQWSRFVDMTAGLSYYRGKYTAADPSTFDFATRSLIVRITEQYDEQSFGADFQLNWLGAKLRAEYIMNEREYTKAGRPLVSTITGQMVFAPDSNRDGYYIVAGYRLPWLNIMPYGMYMRNNGEKDPRASLASVAGWHGGVNILISPYMVLKAEYLVSSLLDPPDDPVLGAKLKALTAQLAWSF